MAKMVKLRIVKSFLMPGGLTLGKINGKLFQYSLVDLGFKEGDIVELRLVEVKKETPKKQGGDLERQTHGIMTPVGGAKKKGA